MSKQRKAPTLWILGACLSAIVIKSSYCSVRPGFRGIVYDTSSSQFEQDLLPEGPHFLMPFVKKPILFPVKTQRLSNILYLTKEKNQYIRYSIKYEPVLSRAKEIYQHLGKDYNIAMESYANTVLRDALVDGSVKISNNMEDQLETLFISKFKDYHFKAHDIKLEEVKL